MVGELLGELDHQDTQLLGVEGVEQFVDVGCRADRDGPESRSSSPRRVDLPGPVLLVAGLVLSVAALTQARNGLGAGPLLLLGAGPSVPTPPRG